MFMRRDQTIYEEELCGTGKCKNNDEKVATIIQFYWKLIPQFPEKGLGFCFKKKAVKLLVSVSRANLFHIETDYRTLENILLLF